MFQTFMINMDHIPNFKSLCDCNIHLNILCKTFSKYVKR